MKKTKREIQVQMDEVKIYEDIIPLEQTSRDICLKIKWLWRGDSLEFDIKSKEDFLRIKSYIRFYFKKWHEQTNQVFNFRIEKVGDYEKIRITLK